MICAAWYCSLAWVPVSGEIPIFPLSLLWNSTCHWCSVDLFSFSHLCWVPLSLLLSCHSPTCARLYLSPSIPAIVTSSFGPGTVLSTVPDKMNTGWTVNICKAQVAEICACSCYLDFMTNEVSLALWEIESDFFPLLVSRLKLGARNSILVFYMGVKAKIIGSSSWAQVKQEEAGSEADQPGLLRALCYERQQVIALYHNACLKVVCSLKDQSNVRFLREPFSGLYSSAFEVQPFCFHPDTNILWRRVPHSEYLKKTVAWQVAGICFMDLTSIVWSQSWWPTVVGDDLLAYTALTLSSP